MFSVFCFADKSMRRMEGVFFSLYRQEIIRGYARRALFRLFCHRLQFRVLNETFQRF